MARPSPERHLPVHERCDPAELERRPGGAGVRPRHGPRAPDDLARRPSPRRRRTLIRWLITSLAISSCCTNWIRSRADLTRPARTALVARPTATGRLRLPAAHRTRAAQRDRVLHRLGLGPRGAVHHRLHRVQRRAVRPSKPCAADLALHRRAAPRRRLGHDGAPSVASSSRHGRALRHPGPREPPTRPPHTPPFRDPRRPAATTSADDRRSRHRCPRTFRDHRRAARARCLRARLHGRTPRHVHVLHPPSRAGRQLARGRRRPDRAGRPDDLHLRMRAGRPLTCCSRDCRA